MGNGKWEIGACSFLMTVVLYRVITPPPPLSKAIGSGLLVRFGISGPEAAKGID